MVTFTGARAFASRVYGDVSDKHVTFMAAGIAYNAFVSLAPLLLLVFAVLSVVGGGLEARVVAAASEWLPGPVAAIVEALFADEGSVGGASAIGLAVLVWGSLKVFRGLETAFSAVYETTGDNSFLDRLRDAVVVLCALVLAVLATLAVTAVFAVFVDAVPLLAVATPLVLVGGLVLAFLPMYYVFPDTETTVRQAVPGAVFAAVGWAAFQSLFQVYLTVSDPGSGSFFGGVIVLVTYLYFSALVLLIGAVINAARADHAVGRPGGVGGTGADERVLRAVELDPDDLDAHLRGLHERLTARYDVAPLEDAPPRPEGTVELVETVRTDDDGGRRWAVELSWAGGRDTDTDRPESTTAPTDD